jgi:hypothetical protein
LAKLGWQSPVRKLNDNQKVKQGDDSTDDKAAAAAAGGESDESEYDE